MSVLATPPSAEHSRVVVGDRTFTIWSWGFIPGTLRGFVTPDPIHPSESDPEWGVDVETVATFKMRHHGYSLPRFSIVQNISVVESMRRQGWASDMVRALMQEYPEGAWEVESPNDQSGPLFNKLAELHPDRVKPSPNWTLS